MFDKLIRENFKAITKERNIGRSNSEVDTFESSGNANLQSKDTAHSSAWYDDGQDNM
jgi:hypothetical protein